MRYVAGCRIAILSAGLAIAGIAGEAIGQSGPFPGVVPIRNGGLQAFYDQNGCTVDYDARGQRITYRSACTTAQLRFADEAVEDYRRSHGLWDDDVAPGGRIERPVVSVDPQGRPYVTFTREICVVYYTPRGRRTSNTQHCSRSQIRQANNVMARYLRDQRPSYR
jgi:hypothetical protein